MTAVSPVTVTTSADHKGKVDFAILTIRDDEFQAVLDRFPPFTRAKGRRIYNLHRLDLPAGGSYLVAVLKCIEQGNTEALDAARDVLEELEPRWLLLVGIAGGVPSDELTLGDVVVSNRIVDFSVEAILQDKASEYALGGGPIHKDAATILANLRALAPELQGWGSAASLGATRPPIEVDDGEFYGDETWQKKARTGLARQGSRTEPIVTAGAIGSSDRLVKDTKILATFLLMAARQVLAVEMESAGVYRAATGRGVPLVAIRGLSDLVGVKRDPGWTAYACHSAAAFTLAFLGTRPIEPRASEPALPKQPNLRATVFEVVRGAEAQGHIPVQELRPVEPPRRLSLTASLPPRPQRFLGRDTIADHLAAAILRDSTPSIVLLGPGGIGKSTLTLVALHRQEIATRFGARRWFVRLDAAPTAEAAARVIATALGVTPGCQPLADVCAFLGVAEGVLALDNLESPWEGDREGTDALLGALTAIPGVVVVVSVRGEQRPAGVAWQVTLKNLSQ